MICCDRCKDKVLGEYRIVWAKGFNALNLEESRVLCKTCFDKLNKFIKGADR